jgi:hypothetical protein
MDLTGLNLDPPTREDVADIVITPPSGTMPQVPIMADFESVIGEVPAFDVTKPAIYIPDLPDDDFPTFNEDAPNLSDPNLPNAPEYTMPTAPTIEDITIPSPPEFNIPSFDGVAPVAALTPPEEMFAYNEAAYNSDLKEKLASELYEQLIAGGTGLDADTEQAIWDRAIARQQEENEKAYQEALNFHAARGFSLPEGVLNSTLIEVNNRINQRKDDLNNDILIQQSKLAQENTHFIIQQALALEQTLMENSNQVQNRAFEAAKAMVQLANETYRIKVEQYVAQLEGYKTLAQVFESKIRAEIAKAEFYKAQIDGLRAGAEVKGIMVQAYNAQIEGIKSLIQMYATQMDAAKIQSDIDLNKLEAYKAKAQVFGIKTEALTSRYNAYQARIAGETEKVKMYTAEAQAYSARIDGYEAAAKVETARAETNLAKHKGDIEGFKAAVEQYKTESDRLIAEAQAKAQIEGVKIEQYRADVSKYQADIDAIVRSCLGKIEKAKAQADIMVKDRELAIQKLLAEKGLTADMVVAQSKIGAQLAAAALTSVSASLSMGLSESRNTSHSQSKSVSSSTSCSDTYIYQE